MLSEQTSKRPSIRRENRSSLNNPQIGRAAYLLACLVMEGVVELDLDDASAKEIYMLAIDKLSHALHVTEPDDPNGWIFMPWMPHPPAQVDQAAQLESDDPVDLVN